MVQAALENGAGGGGGAAAGPDLRLAVRTRICTPLDGIHCSARRLLMNASNTISSFPKDLPFYKKVKNTTLNRREIQSITFICASARIDRFQLNSIFAASTPNSCQLYWPSL